MVKRNYSRGAEDESTPDESRYDPHREAQLLQLAPEHLAVKGNVGSLVEKDALTRRNQAGVRIRLGEVAVVAESRQLGREENAELDPKRAAPTKDHEYGIAPVRGNPFASEPLSQKTEPLSVSFLFEHEELDRAKVVRVATPGRIFAQMLPVATLPKLEPGHRAADDGFALRFRQRLFERGLQRKSVSILEVLAPALRPACTHRKKGKGL